MKKKLHVVYIADIPQVGGAAACLFDMVEYMHSTGSVECTVLLVSDGPVRKKLEISGAETHITGHGSFLVPEPAEKWKIPIKYMVALARYLGNKGKSVKKAEAAVNFDRVDIIHSNLPRNDLGIDLAKRHGIPHICHLRELSFEGFHCWSYRKNPGAYLSNGSDMLIAVSHACRDAWIDVGVDVEKLTVINDGIDVLRYRKPAGWGPKTFDKERRIKIVFLGGCSELKGVWDAIEAVALLHLQEKRPVLLDIYGLGQARIESAVRRYIGLNGLNNVIHLMGFQDNVSQIIAEYDIGLVCSRSEAFGLATVEMMAAGLAVIVSDADANTEIVQDGLSGFVYRISSGPEALAEKIRQVLDNDGLMASLGKRAAEEASKYTRDASFSKVLELYRSLVDGTSTRGSA